MLSFLELIYISIVFQITLKVGKLKCKKMFLDIVYSCIKLFVTLPWVGGFPPIRCAKKNNNNQIGSIVIIMIRYYTHIRIYTIYSLWYAYIHKSSWFDWIGSIRNELNRNIYRFPLTLSSE